MYNTVTFLAAKNLCYFINILCSSKNILMMFVSF